MERAAAPPGGRSDQPRISRAPPRLPAPLRRVGLVHRPDRLVAQHQHLPRSALGPRTGNLWRRPVPDRQAGRRLRHRPAGRRSELPAHRRHAQALCRAQRTGTVAPPRQFRHLRTRYARHLPACLPRDRGRRECAVDNVRLQFGERPAGLRQHRAAGHQPAPELGLHRLRRVRLRRAGQCLSREPAPLCQDARGRRQGVLRSRHGPCVRRRFRDRAHPVRGAHRRAGRGGDRPGAGPTVHRPHEAGPVRSGRARVPRHHEGRLRHARKPRAVAAGRRTEHGVAQERREPAAAEGRAALHRGGRAQCRRRRCAGGQLQRHTLATDHAAGGPQGAVSGCTHRLCRRLRPHLSRDGTGARQRLLPRREVQRARTYAGDLRQSRAGGRTRFHRTGGQCHEELGRPPGEHQHPLDRLHHSTRKRRVHLPPEFGRRVPHLGR